MNRIKRQKNTAKTCKNCSAWFGDDETCWYISCKRNPCQYDHWRSKKFATSSNNAVRVK
jgi:hypothetical protein